MNHIIVDVLPDRVDYIGDRLGQLNIVEVWRGVKLGLNLDVKEVETTLAQSTQRQQVEVKMD